MVESAFAGSRERRLWRLDSLGGRLYILVLSEEKPNLEAAVREYGNPKEGFLTRDYEPLLTRITEQSQWRFRLVANPTQSISRASTGQRGEVRACVGAEQQESWLKKRAEKNGFTLEEGDFRAVGNSWHIFHKREEKDKSVSLREVSYEGILTVTDVEKFKELLCCGMGRGRAYGMGLLTIMRLP
jgi:CRISPR system CASCADE complex protein casE